MQQPRSTDQPTRDNHYVPCWYQRGFLGADESQYYLLDLAPDAQQLPDGRTVYRKDLRRLGPKSCFSEYDLYTTHFGIHANDEIERYLFGSIDDRGADAVRAFIGGNLSSMHDAFEDFFVFLDAQKLRTPKGLDWIRSQYPSLNQHMLMREMQGLRMMHCTMWAEGVREIVSAKNSAVKFIVSDHPITVYNKAFPSDSSACTYPSEPSIALLGTQTIFALDSNTCLILTHLEYAQDPRTAHLDAERTNARFRGPGIARTDAFIRSRDLEEAEVLAINHLLKSRARKYVAAERKEWLYPEQVAWEAIAEVLTPPRNELWRFGGEIYVGYKDGSTHYQDAYGRTSGAHEYLRKERRGEPTPNDGCGCGSGKKFKRCCMSVPPAERPTWDVFGLRERNLMFCHRTKRILGLLDGKTWHDVRRELSGEQVQEIYAALASLWPEDTDLPRLLPSPTNAAFRAVYLGALDPRNIEFTVTEWLSYFDEVVVPHPFINPIRLRPGYSPTKASAKHKAQTLRNVLTLLLLEPYIQMGVVHLVPDPGDFNSAFGTSAMSMAEERTTGYQMSKRAREQLRRFSRDDYWKSMAQLPDIDLRRYLADQAPKSNEEDIEALLAHLKSELAADPSCLLQPLEAGEANAQFRILKGFSLESAMFLAASTGSVLYTDIYAHWDLLHLGAAPLEISNWAPLVEAWQSVHFLIDARVGQSLVYRNQGKFGQLRAAIRNAAQMVAKPAGAGRPDLVASELLKAARELDVAWTHPAEHQRVIGRVTASIPTGGFERAEVRRLLLTFGRANAKLPIPLALLVEFQASPPDS